MESGRAFARRVAVIVLDGWGISPTREWEICQEVYRQLSGEVRAAGRALREDEDVVRAAVAPLSQGVSTVLARQWKAPWRELFVLVRQTRCRWINAVGG